MYFYENIVFVTFYTEKIKRRPYTVKKKGKMHMGANYSVMASDFKVSWEQ